MDRVDEYPRLVQELSSEYGAIKPYYGQVELELVFDRERDRYQLMTLGWEGTRRVKAAARYDESVADTGEIRGRPPFLSTGLTWSAAF